MSCYRRRWKSVHTKSLRIALALSSLARALHLLNLCLYLLYRTFSESLRVDPCLLQFAIRCIEFSHLQVDSAYFEEDYCRCVSLIGIHLPIALLHRCIVPCQASSAERSAERRQHVILVKIEFNLVNSPTVRP